MNYGYGQKPEFTLPRKLEKVLASLSIYYKQQDKLVFRRVIVNSRYHVHEEWTSDNWDGGTYGHAIYFQVPPAIYYEIFDNLENVSQEICGDINRIANVQNEFIAQVFIELQDDPSLENWREQSGALLHPTPAAIISSEEQLYNIWKAGHFRLFISHKAEQKVQATQLKEELVCYGVSCFVAHEDIEPTKEWQNEIEKAMFSMDALVALMTDGIFTSVWVNQEIGVAIGRGVPVIPVRMPADPLGFIGKYQAITCKDMSEQSAKTIYDGLWKYHGLIPKLEDALIAGLENAHYYPHAIKASKELAKKLKAITPKMIERIEKAMSDNHYVADAYYVPPRLKSLIEKLNKDV